MRLLRKAAAGYDKGAWALVISASYAAIVLGVTVFVLVAHGLAGVWLILAAMPVSLLILLIPAEGDLLTLLIALGGLGQAWLLWVVLRGMRLP